MKQDAEIEVPELHLIGQFTSPSYPVQAEGTIGRRSFYFRARWESWSFAVALTSEIDPIDIASSDRGFFREESYGARRGEAGYMPLDEARKIIMKCTEDFLKEHPSK